MSESIPLVAGDGTVTDYPSSTLVQCDRAPRAGGFGRRAPARGEDAGPPRYPLRKIGREVSGRGVRVTVGEGDDAVDMTIESWQDQVARLERDLAEAREEIQALHVKLGPAWVAEIIEHALGGSPEAAAATEG